MGINDDMGFGSGSSDQTFTSTRGFFVQAKPNKVDRTSDPFARFADRQKLAVERLRNPTGLVSNATLQIGCGPVNGLPFEPPQDGGGFKTEDDKEPQNKRPQNGDDESWTETKRQEKKIKVASEDDPDTYIKVLVAVKSLFDTPRGQVLITWIERSENPTGGGAT